MTPSFVARGVVTALSWFFEIRAFAPNDMDDAFQHLAIPRIHWLAVRKVVATLRLQLSDPSIPDEPFELTETIARLDELVTDRLPQLRERMTRARREQRDAPPEQRTPPRTNGQR